MNKLYSDLKKWLDTQASFKIYCIRQQNIKYNGIYFNKNTAQAKTRRNTLNCTFQV